MSVTVSSVSKSLGIPVKDCRSLIKSITNRFPGMEIVSVKKEGDDFVFTLSDSVVVKFSPPYSFPFSFLPFGFSRFNSDDLAFNLSSYLGKNKQLFTPENLSLLKKISLDYSNKEQQTKVYSEIATAFGVPYTQWRTQTLLTTLVKSMPAIIDRILIIENNRIKAGMKVLLKNDTRKFRVVREVKPNFFLRLEGTNSYIDPGNVRVVD